MQNLDGQLGHSDGVVVAIGDVQDILGMKTRKGKGEVGHLGKEISKFQNPPASAAEDQCQKPLTGALNGEGLIFN